jgi:hypothetical protein
MLDKVKRWFWFYFMPRRYVRHLVEELAKQYEEVGENATD